MSGRTRNDLHRSPRKNKSWKKKFFDAIAEAAKDMGTIAEEKIISTVRSYRKAKARAKQRPRGRFQKRAGWFEGCEACYAEEDSRESGFETRISRGDQLAGGEHGPDENA